MEVKKPTVWLIRNDFFDEKLEREQFISIGWDNIPDLASTNLERDNLAALLKKDAPGRSAQSLFAQASIIRRFHDDVRMDDIVVAPRKGLNLIRVGVVAGQYFYA